MREGALRRCRGALGRPALGSTLEAAAEVAGIAATKRFSGSFGMPGLDGMPEGALMRPGGRLHERIWM